MGAERLRLTKTRFTMKAFKSKMITPSSPHITNPNNSAMMRMVELLNGLISHFDEYVGYDLYPHGSKNVEWLSIVYRDTNEQLITVELYPDTIHTQIYKVAKELDNLEIISRRDFVSIDMEVKKLMALQKVEAE